LQTLRKAGWSAIRLHDLRHFYAPGLIAPGCDVSDRPAITQARETGTTLETYSHLWPSAEDKTRRAAATVTEEVLATDGAGPRQVGSTSPLTWAFTR
jgi:hypothetical protein